MGVTTQRDNEGDGGSGGVCTPEPRYITIGRVLRPHGVSGELRVEVITDSPERLELHAQFYLAHPDSPEVVRPFPVEKVHHHKKDIILLKLSGCDSRDQAEALRGSLVRIPFQDVAPLAEGEYYVFQLVGMQVETEDGQNLGRLARVLETGANDVYLVQGPQGELLLPAVETVVRQVDVDANRVVVRLMPGMRDSE